MSPWRRFGIVLYWLAWPALFVYLRIGERTRVAIVADGYILLVQPWLGEARWGLPGGGLHRGEQPAAGAVRETLEETGVQLDPVALKPLGKYWCVQNGIGNQVHFFTVQLSGIHPVRKQFGEMADVQWVPLREVHALPLKNEVEQALALLAPKP